MVLAGCGHLTKATTQKIQRVCSIDGDDTMMFIYQCVGCCSQHHQLRDGSFMRVNGTYWCGCIFRWWTSNLRWRGTDTSGARRSEVYFEIAARSSSAGYLTLCCVVLCCLEGVDVFAQCCGNAHS